MTQATIRATAESDIRSLIEMMRALAEEDGTTPVDPPAAERALRQLLSDPSCGEARIIEESGTPIGYFFVTFGFSLELHGRDAFLDEIYVVPSRRGRGLGQEAIAIAELICRERGAHALHLEVERSNTRAQALYRRTGFVDHDRYLLTKRFRPCS